jgi:hypothetical protein
LAGNLSQFLNGVPFLCNKSIDFVHGKSKYFLLNFWMTFDR